MTPTTPSADGERPPDVESATITQASGGRPESSDDQSTGTDSGRSGRLGKGVAIAAAVVTFVAGVVGLLFTFEPRLSPCLAGADASFTGAPVFPNTSYVQYEQDLGLSRAVAVQYAGYGSGVEVRYSIHTDDLRGHALYLYTTLVTVNPDGSIRGVVRGEDLKNQLRDVPEQCSQNEGSALLVQVPARPRTRYRLILELYRGPTPGERLALTETGTFKGMLGPKRVR